MCEHKNSSAVNISNTRTALIGMLRDKEISLEEMQKGSTGSRRKRLWELPAHTHCPLVGTCLPMPLLRRLIGKALGSHISASDYEFHVAAVTECAARRPISEILQREMDRRYAVEIKRFSKAKTTEEVACLWQEALKSSDIAGALWASFSHPRCDESLRERVCHDIHMFQHQLGACNLADMQRLEQLQEESTVLSNELSALKERHANMMQDRSVEIEDLNRKLMQQRSQLIARETALTALQDELQALRNAVPSLPQRAELSRKLEEQQKRIQELMQERLHWQQRAEQEANRAIEVAAKFAAWEQKRSDDDAIKDNQSLDEQGLQDKAVLCVGGRPASVPVYRRMIERTGGTFLHHDGGEEHSHAQLEASLAAADLVICQAGCISHHAYWRVKDYCKRTGKQCMFVEKPSTTSFARCLHQLVQHDG